MFYSLWQASNVLWTLHSRAHLTSNDITESRFFCSYPIAVNDKEVMVDQYEPIEPYAGTLVVIHGMSPKGKQDPRVMLLCYALRRVGYRVIAPDIESIKNLMICSSQVGDIASTLSAIVKNKTLTPRGTIGLMAPSFSGGMCLAVASLPELKNHVTAVCAIGAFTEVNSVMNYLLNDDTADLYGRFIVLKKIVPLVCDDYALFEEALDAAIKDNLNEVNFDEFTNAYNCYLSSLTEQDRQKIRRLFHDVAYREQLFNSSKRYLSDELKGLDIISRIKDLSANVLLLHGNNDNVIPHHQSERLFHKLKDLKKKTELVVTPFISHGDTQFKLSQLTDIMKLIKGFSRYFRNVSRLNT
ncbi:alpha/beta hydrolase family protein [Alkalimarinus alittae]|uniref:Prolyl oligopeptidase family serine peptidase n=1 Tax=Alkalimarinus alittae TaxID=2961619 RepID=A0ABY6MXL7_9ALTE|nr:prolyl oligopeptidase family serine peptidase [Alkalimarinus alittae]UZE94545.1 prolyl oligopeptidase family serine peptidase [Alkalimarinus alittae]